VHLDVDAAVISSSLSWEALRWMLVRHSARGRYPIDERMDFLKRWLSVALFCWRRSGAELLEHFMALVGS
jgi:hypothetical protein